LDDKRCKTRTHICFHTSTEQANKLEIQISKYNAYSEYYTKLATQLLEGSGLLNEDAQKLRDNAALLDELAWLDNDFCYDSFAYCLLLVSNGLLLGLETMQLYLMNLAIN
jgi:hypothetical protein